MLTLGEDEVVEIVELSAGEQHTDAQGNLVIVYGISDWPEAFDAMTASSRSEFEFALGLDALQDPELSLVALDIGMCAAGIGLDDSAVGFGTAEFFVHETAEAPLSSEPTTNRALVTNPPIAGSGFDFPAQASCARGLLPVVRTRDGSPTVARYVLTNRTSSTAPIERHVYQWQLDPAAGSGPSAVATGSADDSADDSAEEPFSIGQTVTFNDGPASDTTVVVEGWAELVGQQASIEGTRPVGVLLSFCPSSAQLVDFGLAVDGWNLLAPDLGENGFGAFVAGDPAGSCFDGWLRFAVPFGAVPTGFFTSDGDAAETGYAFWSLDGAALLPPPSE